MKRFKGIRPLIGGTLGIVLLGLAVFLGCASGHGGIKDWDLNAGGTVLVNVKGGVTGPLASVSSVRGQFGPDSLKGVRVFLESDPRISTETDEEGKFFLTGVPAGSQRFVVYTNIGGTSYRQRSPLFKLDSNYQTLELDRLIRLEEAKYFVNVHVKDLTTENPVAATLSIWGFTEQTINGYAILGPFPQSNTGEELKITGVGYRPVAFPVNFNDKNKAELYVKMTPLTSVDLNRAPVVDILHDKVDIRLNDSINLSAYGFDPDGDPVTWKWQANGGSLSNTKGANTVFTATEDVLEIPSVAITLTGTDPSGAESQAVLKLNLIKDGPKHEPEETEPEF